MCIRTKKKGGFLWQDRKNNLPSVSYHSPFTDMEYGLITDAAEETGVTLSEYIRKMVLEGKIAIRYEVVADIPELQKLTAEFGKIGSNLNQIARYFHTGGVRSKTMQDEIQSCISELWNLRKDVTRMAGDFHGSVETYRK